MSQVIDERAQRQDVERMLLDGAQQFLQARHSLQRARCWRSEGRGFDARMWSAMAECGWLGMRLPEELGGFGLELSAAAALASRLGAALLPDPFAGCGVAPAALLAALPASDLRDALAGELSDGAQVLAIAWQAHYGEIDPAWSGAVLSRDAQGLVLDGMRVAVEGAAGQWLVAACEDGQPRLVLVPAQAAGVRRVSQLRADGSAMETLHFHQVRIGAAALLATGAAARRALAASLDETRVVAAAYLAGLAQAALEMTAGYLAQRVQFGQPLAALQALRHRLVDLDLQKRLAFASWRKACEIHADAAAAPETFAAAASAAKARCAELALRVAREAMQLHGAIGYTQEADIGLFADAALRHAPAFGNAPGHRRRFAELAFAASPCHAATGLTPPRPAGPHPATPDAWAQLSDAEFAEQLASWLHAHYPPEWRQPIVLRLRGAAERDWLGTLYRHGLRAPGIARAHGGMGLPLRKQLIYKQVFDAHGVARVLDMGSTLLAPILIRYGSAEQQARYLPAILRGEDVWCQGYSEPGAGSDLASLRTSARRQGDGFVVNGQKIWTSHANNASRIFMLVRTGQYERKQQGISLLLVDLDTPGITVRPIVNMAGDDEFCEVFFDNVEVPAGQLLGQLDDGWNVAKSLLGVERLVNGSPALAQQAFDYLRQMLAAAPDMRAAALRDDRLAQRACDLHDFHGLYAEICAAALAGQPLDAEYSVLKLISTELFQQTVDLVMELAAERGAANGAQAFGAASLDLHRLYMVSRPGTIYGGASEVQRDILARSLLGAKTR